MTALSNATRRDGKLSPTTRLASDVLPEAHSSDTGVSVSYAHSQGLPPGFQPHPKKRWFVLRITYRRAQKARQLLSQQGILTYMPMRYTLRAEGQRQRRVTTPLLPDFLFAYAEPDALSHVISHQGRLFRALAAPTADDKRRRIFTPPETKIITYYYNHFHKANDGKNPPLTIRHADMLNFIRLTSLQNEHIRLVAPRHVHYRGGDKVRIIDGQFKGICGHVARVAGQQRVVVELEGVCLVTTAYVPSAFIVREGEGV